MPIVHDPKSGRFVGGGSSLSSAMSRAFIHKGSLGALKAALGSAKAGHEYRIVSIRGSSGRSGFGVQHKSSGKYLTKSVATLS